MELNRLESQIFHLFDTGTERDFRVEESKNFRLAFIEVRKNDFCFVLVSIFQSELTFRVTITPIKSKIRRTVYNSISRNLKQRIEYINDILKWS